MSGEDAGVFALFVDLKKAFDSVDRETLWRLLEEKCGVPHHVVQAIRNMHDGMHAQTLHRGKLGQRFGTETGVRQGAIEGPTLWNIFYCFLLLDCCAYAHFVNHISQVTTILILYRVGQVWDFSS